MSGVLSNIHGNVSYAMRKHIGVLIRLQEKASTGSDINRSSDDPSGGYRVLTLNSNIRKYGNYIDNIADLISTLELSSTILDGVGGEGGMIPSLTEVKTRLTQISSGTYDDQSRLRFAEGINDLLEEIISLANTKHNNRYLFGGGNASGTPYAVTRTNGSITSVTYQGSLQVQKVNVSPGVQSHALYVGDDVFRNDNRQVPSFILGTTGIQAGTGTSSMTGYTWMTVTHDAGDNEYDISIDGGESFTSIPDDGSGSPNQMITDSVTGKVLYIDATTVTSAGTEMVCVDGTHDIFNLLMTVRDMYLNENNLSSTQISQISDSIIPTIEEVNELLLQTSVSLGSRINFLDNMQTTLDSIKFSNEDEATGIQEADIAQIAIDLSRHEVLYEMSLAVAAKIMSMSLLDFIR